MDEERGMCVEEALRLARVRGMPGRVEIQDNCAVREETGEHRIGEY